MISATEAATVAYLSMTNAALSSGASRPAVPNIRNIEDWEAYRPPTQIIVDCSGIAETAKAIDIPVSVTTPADASVAQLLRFEKLDANWDGFGAAKPDAESAKAARAFIRKLAPESLVPTPALHANGSTILYFKGHESYVELEFTGSHIEYFARQGNQEWESEFLLDGELPAALQGIGFSI
ncbi:hypothetical protein [Rhodopseudomonas sp. BR0G17]|uniref:hypothetical protein n=1 Tax=Rhodopseudomonas sp. BR0G17 TaxID=2269368 RepID=UPI0013DEAE8A|nr:hypothetical protein [Rhodopseudomonas sp. BR0G17]